jgi:hypothetical protein
MPRVLSVHDGFFPDESSDQGDLHCLQRYESVLAVGCQAWSDLRRVCELFYLLSHDLTGSFNLNSPSQGLTLVPSISSGTYQGANYQWSVSTGAPDGTDALPGMIG